MRVFRVMLFDALEDSERNEVNEALALHWRWVNDAKRTEFTGACSVACAYMQLRN